MSCTICDHNTTGKRTICDRCYNQIDHNLEQIRDLTVDAATWTRRHGNTKLIHVSQSTPPLSIGILDAQLGLTALHVLEDHEKHARRLLGLTRYGPASHERNRSTASTEHLFTCIAWLRSNLALMAETPTVLIEELHFDSGTLVRSLQTANPNLDAPAATIIKCPADHPDADGRNCGQQLRINPEQPDQTIHCARCKTTWTIDRLMRVALAADVEVWAEAEWIRAWFGVHQRTLNQWVKDGRIHKRGDLYSIPDTIKTAAEARLS